jgi:shikimate dehydrogenase
MRLFGLLGYPLTHSFSQKYFTEKFQQLGIPNASYENFSIPDIYELKAILNSRNGLEGFNITIPYKKSVIDFLDELSEPVKKMGACNCVKISNGKLKGFNTDIVGFQKSLQPFLKPIHQKALILGTGGASAAVEYVFQQLDISYQFVSRNASQNAISYQELTQEIMESHTLIINTTPLGMYPNSDACPEIPYQFLTEKHHLFDLIYNPTETRFLSLGKQQGASIQNGYEMLILQAEESWRIWNDVN